MFDLVKSITLCIYRALKSVCKHCMFLFPAVLILGDSWIYVYSLYSRDIVSDIKISVNETLGFYAALIIPYIYSDDSHI